MCVHRPLTRAAGKCLCTMSSDTEETDTQPTDKNSNFFWPFLFFLPKFEVPVQTAAIGPAGCIPGCGREGSLGTASASWLASEGVTGVVAVCSRVAGPVASGWYNER